MNALILAAGYATRLYPLTLNRAKPLLPIGGQPIIQWVVEQLEPAPDLERIIVITNNRFAGDFSDWTNSYRPARPIAFQVINDGSNSDSDKLGAIGDIFFAAQKADLFSTDLLVVAGDNLFSESLAEFAKFGSEHPATLGVYNVQSLEQARKYNELTTNPAGIVTKFIEKPQNPTSTICGIALYYYQPEVLHQLANYLAEENNPDQPGRFVQWLHQRIDVFTYPIGGIWYDIGSYDTLAEADRLFSGLGRQSASNP
jgi:glucose-1-phosphate thymidylyltransferase